MAKTTKKQYDYFADKVEHWQDFWHLGNWRIEVVVGDSGENYAHVHIVQVARAATIVLSDSSNESVSNYQLNKTAFHEVCEILLTQLIKCADAAAASDKVEEISHDIIRRLENIVFELHKDE